MNSSRLRQAELWGAHTPLLAAIGAGRLLFLRKSPLINTLLWLGVTVPLGFSELLQQFSPMPYKQNAEAIRTLCSSDTSLKRDGNEFTPLPETQRESLDTERITFTMLRL